MEPTVIWAFVIIGGPILLGLAALWARGRAAKRNSTTDPGTPADDPAKGLGQQDHEPRQRNQLSEAEGGSHQEARRDPL